MFLEKNQICLELMERGFKWLDTGIHKNLLQSSNFNKTVKSFQSFKKSYLEEIAFKMGDIYHLQLKYLVQKINNKEYSKYLLRLL